MHNRIIANAALLVSKEAQIRWVEHVTVNEGGRAIVGNVAPNGTDSTSKSGPTP